MERKTADCRVVKSNLLIESRYQLSLTEIRMFLIMVKDISLEDTEFAEHKMYIRDFIEDAKIKDRAIYSRLKDIAKKFVGRYIDLKKSEDEFDYYPLMAKFHYKLGREYIIYKFNDCLKEHLLRLRKNFTRYDIRNVVNCKSVYSIRIYELIKSIEYKKSATYELQELKLMFGCEERYRKWSDFRRFVLETSQRELKKWSDTYFDFEGVKKGRSVKEVCFKVKKQEQQRLYDTRQQADDETSKIIYQQSAAAKIAELQDAEKGAVPIPAELKRKLKGKKPVRAPANFPNGRGRADA